MTPMRNYSISSGKLFTEISSNKKVNAKCTEWFIILWNHVLPIQPIYISYPLLHGCPCWYQPNLYWTSAAWSHLPFCSFCPSWGSFSASDRHLIIMMKSVMSWTPHKYGSHMVVFCWFDDITVWHLCVPVFLSVPSISKLPYNFKFIYFLTCPVYWPIISHFAPLQLWLSHYHFHDEQSM